MLWETPNITENHHGSWKSANRPSGCLTSTWAISEPHLWAPDHRGHWGPKRSVYQVANKIISNTKKIWSPPKGRDDQKKALSLQGSLEGSFKSAKDHKWVAGPILDTFTNQRTTRKNRLNSKSLWYYQKKKFGCWRETRITQYAKVSVRKIRSSLHYKGLTGPLWEWQEHNYALSRHIQYNVSSLRKTSRHCRSWGQYQWHRISTESRVFS